MISLWHWAGCGGALGARWSPRAPWHFACQAAFGDIDVAFAWEAWRLATSNYVLRGRRGISYGTGLRLVARLGLAGRRGAAALCVAGVALMALGCVWWHAWGLLVAGALRHFAWQAWRLWHWAGSGGALGRPVVVRGAAALCVAGVALGDFDLRLAWQAWHLVTSTTLSHTTLSRTIFHISLSHATLSHTALSHTTLSHTNFSHTSLSHTTLSPATLSHTIFQTHLSHMQLLSHTHLCHTQLCHAALSHTTLSHTIFHTHTHTQLCHTQLFHTQLFTTLSQRKNLSHATLLHAIFHTHNFVPRVFDTHTHLCHTHNLVTSIFVIHNFVTHAQLCYTPSFTLNFVTHVFVTHTHSFATHTQLCHTQLCHTQLCHTQLCHTHTHTIFHTQLCHTHTHIFVTQLGHTHLCHMQLCHTPSLCGRRGAWRHQRCICVAGVARVALGDIHLRFAWQAWHLATSTALCVAGVALMAWWRA